MNSSRYIISKYVTPFTAGIITIRYKLISLVFYSISYMFIMDFVINYINPGMYTVMLMFYTVTLFAILFYGILFISLFMKWCGYTLDLELGINTDKWDTVNDMVKYTDKLHIRGMIAGERLDMIIMIVMAMQFVIIIISVWAYFS